MNSAKIKQNTIILTIIYVLASIFIYWVILKFVNEIDDLDENLTLFPVFFFIYLVINLFIVSYLIFHVFKAIQINESIEIVNLGIEEYKNEVVSIEKEEEEKRKKVERKLMTKQITLNIMNVDLRKTNNISDYCSKLLKNIAIEFEIVQALFFVKNRKNDTFEVKASYALTEEKLDRHFLLGEGIPGQVALNRKFSIIRNIPEDYITIESGLGKSSPHLLAFLPILYNNHSIGIVEMAFFQQFPDDIDVILMEISETVGNDISKL